MRVKLIFPPNIQTPFSMYRTIVPPLALASITGHLRKLGFQVMQDDLDVRMQLDNNIVESVRNLPYGAFADNRKDATGQFEDVLHQLLAKTEYLGCDIVGFSIASPFQLSSALGLARLIKEDSGMPVVFGGGVATQKDEEILRQNPFVDYILRSEGELSMGRLCESLDGMAGDFDCVPNLSCIEEGKLQRGPWRTLAFNDLPTPDFDGLPLDLYIKNAGILLSQQGMSDIPARRITLPYQISQGCLYNCAFCGTANSVFKNKTSVKVSEDLDVLSKKYNPHFMFKDNIVNFNYRYLHELCNHIVRNGADFLWSDSAVLSNIDQSLLKSMHSSGCRQLIFGLESASQKMLGLMNKRTDIGQAIEILRNSSDEGVWNSLHIMLGFPHEGEKDFEDTLGFVKSNAEFIDNLQVHPFHLHKGTAVCREPSKFKVAVIKGSEQQISYEDNDIMGYNEIGGLDWHARNEKTRVRFGIMNSALCKVNVFAETVLYLYDRLGGKPAVSEYLSGLVAV